MGKFSDEYVLHLEDQARHKDARIRELEGALKAIRGKARFEREHTIEPHIARLDTRYIIEVIDAVLRGGEVE